MKLSLLAGAALMFASTSVAASAANLVAGGDFENVTPGTTFITEYNKSDPSRLNAGQYVVTDDAQKNHVAFHSLGHGGSGNFFAVNAASEPKIAWQQTINGVVAGQQYFFEAFLTDLSLRGTGNQAHVEFFVEQDNLTKSLGAFFVGKPIYDEGTETRTPGWLGVSNIYTSLSSSAVTLTLKNISTANSGNDFGLDSINFSNTSIVDPGSVLPPIMSAVPEPTSWALMIVGFGLTGAALRRRTKSLSYA